MLEKYVINRMYLNDFFFGLSSNELTSLFENLSQILMRFFRTTMKNKRKRKERKNLCVFLYDTVLSAKEGYARWLLFLFLTHRLFRLNEYLFQ